MQNLSHWKRFSELNDFTRMAVAFFIDIGDLGAWSKMIQLRVHKVQVKGTESQKLRVLKVPS